MLAGDDTSVHENTGVQLRLASNYTKLEGPLQLINSKITLPAKIHLQVDELLLSADSTIENIDQEADIALLNLDTGGTITVISKMRLEGGTNPIGEDIRIQGNHGLSKEEILADSCG